MKRKNIPTWIGTRKEVETWHIIVLVRKSSRPLCMKDLCSRMGTCFWCIVVSRLSRMFTFFSIKSDSLYLGFSKCCAVLEIAPLCWCWQMNGKGGRRSPVRLWDLGCALTHLAQHLRVSCQIGELSAFNPEPIVCCLWQLSCLAA